MKAMMQTRSQSVFLMRIATPCFQCRREVVHLGFVKLIVNPSSKRLKTSSHSSNSMEVHSIASAVLCFLAPRDCATLVPAPTAATTDSRGTQASDS